MVTDFLTLTLLLVDFRLTLTFLAAVPPVGHLDGQLGLLAGLERLLLRQDLDLADLGGGRRGHDRAARILDQELDVAVGDRSFTTGIRAA